VPLSQTGAELLFEVFRQRYERGSTVVTSNRAARHPFVMAAVLERPSRILPVNSGRLRNTLGPGAWLHVAVRSGGDGAHRKRALLDQLRDDADQRTFVRIKTSDRRLQHRVGLQLIHIERMAGLVREHSEE
jgi:hypothetical protein